jgi:hypothetical protein
MAQDEKVFQVAPNFTRTAGNHTLRFGGDARDADILTSERKTMNGSTEAETAHRPAWGGLVGGSVSVPTPSGSKESPRCGRGRTLAK